MKFEMSMVCMQWKVHSPRPFLQIGLKPFCVLLCMAKANWAELESECFGWPRGGAGCVVGIKPLRGTGRFNASCPLSPWYYILCSPGESTRHTWLHTSCRSYGIDTLRNLHGSVWCMNTTLVSRLIRAAFMHRTDRGQRTLKHYAALKGLR